MQSHKRAMLCSKLLLRLCKASMVLYKEFTAAKQKLDIEGIERIVG